MRCAGAWNLVGPIFIIGVWFGSKWVAPKSSLFESESTKSGANSDWNLVWFHMGDTKVQSFGTV
jgi:hypothetical protein